MLALPHTRSLSLCRSLVLYISFNKRESVVASTLFVPVVVVVAVPAFAFGGYYYVFFLLFSLELIFKNVLNT